MRRIALVVQRCHESIAGGTETLAREYATLLSGRFAVDILTTTAVDHMTWLNVLPEGVEPRGPVTIRRFTVDFPRSLYWHQLHARVLRDYRPLASGWASRNGKREPWTEAMQEEFIRQQGPFSSSLLRFLETAWERYDLVIFVTYLYPTTYFAITRVPFQRAVLVAALHDEVEAYLAAFRRMAHRARFIFWLTEAERRVGAKLWGECPGAVIGMAVNTALASPASSKEPYALYCGRIEVGKGTLQLLQFFSTFKRQYPSRLRLVLTGDGKMPIPERRDIEYRGFVTPAEKFSLMAGATVFLMPSPAESFSIVTLEAMAQRTPVVANRACEVLADHVSHSGGGWTYATEDEFCETLAHALAEPTRLRAMGRHAREYVVERYSRDRIRSQLTSAVEALLTGG